jgi:photosystem II stability/assembly factor-like uncharacterized protein
LRELQMKPYLFFLLLTVLTAVLLAACGLGEVEISVGEGTMESPVAAQVVTVIVVATPTSETLETVFSPPDTPTPPPPEIAASDKQTAADDTPTPTPAAISSLPSGNWQFLSGLPRYINDLVAEPQNPRRLYAGTGTTGSGSGVYKSEDGGVTWHLAVNGLPSEDVLALALSAAESPLLYALVGIRGDVYASEDGGQNWTLMGNSGLFGGFEHWLHVDAHHSNVIFALAKSGELRYSRDGGHVWLPFGEGLPRDEHSIHVLALAFDPTDSNVIYVGTGGFVGGGHGVYKTVNGGQTWSAINQGMLDYRITALATDPNHPQTVYAGADDGTFFKTTNGGQTWSDLSANLPLARGSYPTVRKIVVDRSGMIFLMADRGGVFTSSDEGQTWQAWGSPSPDSDYSAMVVDFGPELMLVIGTRRDGSWRYGEQ